MSTRRLPVAALALLVVVVSSAAEVAAAAERCEGRRWLGAWAAPPSDAEQAGYSRQTLRLVLTPLRSGSVARVRFSNRFGTRPVLFSRVYLGRQRSRGRPALAAGSNRVVRFRGRRQVRLPAGRDVVSDPVRISFRAFRPLAVSVYVPRPTGPATRHGQAHQTSFVSAPGAGDLSARASGSGYSPLSSTAPVVAATRPFVTGLDVVGSQRDGVVAAIGDSITDGDQRTPTLEELGVDEDARYPDFLARRLSARRSGGRFSMLNLGIGGNRILRDIPGVLFGGPSLLGRLKPDLLSRRDVTDVILLEGINDLGIPPLASADEVIGGLRRVVRRLRVLRPRHRRPRLNVLVGTLTPSVGFGGVFSHGTPETNAKRDAINRWIRTGGIGDGVVDFDRALRDPSDPSRLAARYDSGDHLHPSSAGYRRMAQALGLARLRGPACRTERARGTPRFSG